MSPGPVRSGISWSNDRSRTQNLLFSAVVHGLLPNPLKKPWKPSAHNRWHQLRRTSIHVSVQARIRAFWTVSGVSEPGFPQESTAHFSTATSLDQR